jgi:alpha-galactosidase
LTLQKEKSKQSEEDRQKVIEMETNSPVLAAIAALDTKLTGEISHLDQKLTGDIKQLRSDLTGEIKALDSKLTDEITQLRTEMNTNFQTIDKRLDNLEKGQSNTNQNLFHLVEILNLDRENHITLYKE